MSPVQSDAYLASRHGSYENRAVRYRHTADFLIAAGLTHDHTITDLGAGWTELDYCLRAEYGWRGRYIPVDGGIDGTNLNNWSPARRSDFYVALEIVEHLHSWRGMLQVAQAQQPLAIAVSTPNPATCDVLAMDDTHVTEVHPSQLTELGFQVEHATFYGGFYSAGRSDALFATWRPEQGGS